MRRLNKFTQHELDTTERDARHEAALEASQICMESAIKAEDRGLILLAASIEVVANEILARMNKPTFIMKYIIILIFLFILSFYLDAIFYSEKESIKIEKAFFAGYATASCRLTNVNMWGSGFSNCYETDWREYKKHR